MGGIEREIIWNENVRPSSPTPQTLKTYKLAMLDQLTPFSIVPATLYFPSNAAAGISDTAETLKRSLSLILSRFYPLAGRVGGDGHSIDCNDEGVPFVVARFRGCTLSDHVLNNPDLDLLRRLLPCDVRWSADHERGGPDSSVMLIQANFFDCGGAAVAAVFWHKVVDAGAISSFIRSWAATARGSSTEAACPNFIAQSLFSHKEELLKQSLSLSAFFKTGNAVMRRYVFEAAAVAKLKAECGGGDTTRVVAVSALIWKCFMAASLANNNSVSVLSHIVNLRRRARPPFPLECFGNLAGVAAAASSNESEADLGVLARKIKDSIGKIDGQFVERLRGDGGVAGYYENLRRTWSDIPVGGADVLSISSWCGFGFNSFDFGWGKPAWVTGHCDSTFINIVCLMDSRNGDGVEAWVTLDQEYMNVFHQLNHLRALLAREDDQLHNE